MYHFLELVTFSKLFPSFPKFYQKHHPFHRNPFPRTNHFPENCFPECIISWNLPYLFPLSLFSGIRKFKHKNNLFPEYFPKINSPDYTISRKSASWNVAFPEMYHFQENYSSKFWNFPKNSHHPFPTILFVPFVWKPFYGIIHFPHK